MAGWKPNISEQTIVNIGFKTQSSNVSPANVTQHENLLHFISKMKSKFINIQHTNPNPLDRRQLKETTQIRQPTESEESRLQNKTSQMRLFYFDTMILCTPDSENYHCVFFNKLFRFVESLERHKMRIHACEESTEGMQKLLGNEVYAKRA
ncbi:hypothetical protein CSKR_107850 [Clonorchis sinensis]|uniref:Uncharacterized protein n=1 Tax=Clonorchis sinensis TaxID=79923 RepID=A0A3R7C2G2_CLOSI|nr:hypothetical protein CSKR_107850 [Clonorchis sinensis]